jgi:hypothetical protein
MDQSKPMLSNIKIHSILKNYSFKWLSMLVFVQNRKYLNYEVRVRLKSTI